MTIDIQRETQLFAEYYRADLSRDIFLGGVSTDAPSVNEELTTDKLLNTMNAFRDGRPPAIPTGPKMIESIYCTVSKEKWIQVQRSWRARLFGGRLPLWRGGIVLIVLLLAASLSGWLALALPFLSLRSDRWRMAQRPGKIYEDVPDPNFYIIDGCIVAHPVTMVELRSALAERKLTL